jgi:tungstate transport system ATP-binding protein
MILNLSHIHKQYGGKAILHDCSYVFNDPGTYVLMGANGCGKSTLLRIMALLERPDRGTIEFFETGRLLSPDAGLSQRIAHLYEPHSKGSTFDAGRLLTPDLALRRRITLVLPRIGLFNTTVWKNVAYGLSIRGLRGAAAEKKISSTLAFVGLEKKLDQHALTLSSGETQRLGIARALVLKPEILFLDEPTASIDEENTGIIESIIRTMKQEGKSMVVMTTHDRAQAERLADRLLLLKQGALHELA